MPSVFDRVKRKGARQANTGSSVSLVSEDSPSPEELWEDVDLSSTEYARTRRELMQLVNDLRSLGAETMMDLPSFVVIGSQSAGKSSLVEAVSGVNVPRDSGTCTRCPMECTMSSNATTWSCKIKLRFDYDSFGRSAVNSKEVDFGPAVTDRNQVDIWLRRAQAAILNPDIPPDRFLKQSLQELKNFSSLYTLKFSRNVVSIFIEDPNSTDLSFVDLPGLIQNEETEVVELVRQLTESYISRPNTIILTTIPMTDDMQNQLSVKLAREADPQGERTIGILTKPDILGDGAISSRSRWLDVIEGREHLLKHGYYCVRLSDDAQRALHLSRSELQRIAAEYFDMTPPWSAVADRGRFGIPAFVTDVSVLLVSHIKKVIPQLREKVEELLASCLEEIGAFPKPLEVDPQIEVLARVNAFCGAFKGVVSGASSEKSLAQRNRALYAAFSKEIRGTSPDFRPFENPTNYMRIDTLDLEECSEVQDHRVQTMGVYEVRKIIQEATAWELPGNIPYEAKTRLIHRFTILWTLPAEKCLRLINDVLDDIIQKLVKEHFGRFKVLHDLISDLIRPDIEEHKESARAAVKATLELESAPVYTQNLKDFEDLRGKWLNKYRRARQNPREHVARVIPSAGPGRLKTKGKRSNKDTLTEVVPCDLVRTIEAEPVYDDSWVQPAQQTWCGMSSSTPEEEEALLSLAKAGYKNLTLDNLASLKPRDNFEEELVVMADVRAYFTVAYKRIIDGVSLKIEHSLHQALAERLSVNLLHRLLVNTTSTGNLSDRMNELVSEDPAVQAKRSQLETKRARLEEMRRKLVNIAA